MVRPANGQKLTVGLVVCLGLSGKPRRPARRPWRSVAPANPGCWRRSRRLRLARALQQAAELRILEPPLPLKPITETMFWHPRSEDDPAHRWLREELAELAASVLVST